jgi:FMN-dependent NADH-azoreductase
MSTVLVLNTSVLGESSVSRGLVREALARLRAENASLSVIERDLGAMPIPHLDGDSTAAIRGGATENEAQRKALALSDALLAELLAADTLVIGSPMYNFGIPSTLKAWFDYVLRPRIAFSYSEAGPKGLLTGKRAIVIETRGGIYSEGPAIAMDSQEPHLRSMLGFMGITDVAFVRAEKLAFTPEIREQAVLRAKSELAELARQPFLAAS